jgi:putative DNA primase/helicase
MNGITIAASEWNKNKYHLNCQNGTLDLSTLILKPHDPTDLLTKITNVNYDPDASDGAWNDHLKYFLPNENVRRELQRNLGIGICGALLAEILPIWYGTGGNGKTTTSNILQKLLGEYVRNAPANVLMRKRNEDHPEAIADLAGSRLVFCEEITGGQKLAEGVVKSLTGGGVKRSRMLYGNRFTFEQTFNIYLLVNDKPKIDGTDFGIWRRVRLIPWEVTVDVDKQKPQTEILKRLEENGSAILNWLIAGLKDFEKDTKWVAPEVIAATNDYRAKENSVVGFIMKECELNMAFMSTKSELFDFYVKYCTELSIEPTGKRDFGEILTEHYKIKDKKGTGGQRLWVGIKIKEEKLNSGSIFEDNKQENSGFSGITTMFSESVKKNNNTDTFQNTPENATKATDGKKDAINTIAEVFEGTVIKDIW